MFALKSSVKTYLRTLTSTSSTFTISRSFSISSTRMASSLPSLPIFKAIKSHDPKSIAIIHSASGRQFSYGELLNDVADARKKLREQAKEHSLAGQRVAFLAENGYDYVGAN